MSARLLSDLPEELLEYILLMVSPYRDLKSTMTVCKQWYRITHGVTQKVQADFLKAVKTSSLEWLCSPCEGKPTITERYSHSSVYHDKCVYVFGGCTSSNTTFNDLWCFDLANRVWVRPLAMGTYPSPKACASMVVHQKKLYLFGGWSHPTPYPLHQAARFYNQLHTYTPADNKWRLVATHDPPPGKAGHAAAIIRNMMILFGGSHGHGLSSNELWVLELSQMRWRKEAPSGKKPSARYGHAMLVLDDFHLLVLGGCGGPNMQYTDIWLLDTSVYPWQWHEITITNQEHAPPQLWCHGACKVGDKVIVLSKATKPPVTPDPPPAAPIKPLLSTQLAQARRAMPDTSESSSQDSSSDTDTDVIQRNCRGARLRAMGRSPHHRAAPRGSASSAQVGSEEAGKSSTSHEGDQERMDVDEVDICMVCHSDKDLCTCEGGFCGTTVTVAAATSSGFSHGFYSEKPQSAPSGSSVDGSLSKSSSLSASSEDSVVMTVAGNSLSDVGEKVVPFKIPFKSSFKGAMPSVRPNASRNRQKQLDTLRMYEEKFKAKMAAAGVESKDVKVQGHNVEVVVNAIKRPQNPMYVHTLDLGSVLRNHTVSWLPLQPNQGTAIPEETIFYSLHSGRGELIMFGGIQADLTSMQRGVTVDKQVVTNKVYLLKPKVQVR